RGSGLGRGTMPEMVEYSVVSAVTTMWLVARSRGLGVGWVSILDPLRLKRDLDVPESWRLVAYLCLGYPIQEHDVPELVRNRWQGRAPWRKLVLRR
ncbi:MAG: nitroreductase family protein, partial [Alphaproteobacteria bacterium]